MIWLTTLIVFQSAFQSALSHHRIFCESLLSSTYVLLITLIK
uniref:Uncharacterized protein n=1 Tax=Cyanidioschyzon merolae (strain NIES-3377 / 10D) TaxID=280699 RepID=Q85FS7_CYAM1|nr:ORF41 [Cyanidioschyzon merolae strain 10D]BAC76268.1 unnamed protein product [Cyanidioschyzon merolae strain 10D]